MTDQQMPLNGDMAAEIRRQFATAREAIAADASLSAEGKTSAVQAAADQANEKIAALQAEHDAADAAERARLERKLLGAPAAPLGATATDRLALTSSYRDAITRAQMTTDATELAALQSTAQLIGDSVLERATMVVGMQRGDADVVNAWSARNPRDEADADALFSVMHLRGGRRNELRDTLAKAMTFGRVEQ